MRNLNKIQKLVGNITEDDLEQVDCAVCDSMGIFVPSTGFCKYAITKNHTHPGYMFIVLVTAGQHVVEPAITVKKNHFLACALSPEIPHTEKSDGDFNRYYAVMIAPAYFENIYRSYTEEQMECLNWYQFEVPSETVFYIRQFISEYENGNSHSDAMLDNLSGIITHTFIRALLWHGEKNGGSGYEPGMENLIEYIEQNFGQKIEAKQLAKLAYMSVSHLDRKFKQAYGKSPFQYLVEIRIAKAKQLLKQNNESVIDIALRCGFSSPANFTSLFKRYTGVNPSQYRKIYILKHD
jgi:AraC family transcriptional regulator